MLNDVTIYSNNDYYYSLPCQKRFPIDIQESFIEKTRGVEITHKVALAALRSIERKSRFLSIVTHPLASGIVGIAVCALGFAALVLASEVIVPVAAIALNFLAASLFLTGFGLSLHNIGRICVRPWKMMDKAYNKQAEVAHHLIKEIEGKIKRGDDFRILIDIQE